ncbi:MAG: hypothetical protein AVDCRST_MAG15-369, partial [uncultured Rubellimicrobium sp.]
WTSFPLKNCVGRHLPSICAAHSGRPSRASCRRTSRCFWSVWGRSDLGPCSGSATLTGWAP